MKLTYLLSIYLILVSFSAHKSTSIIRDHKMSSTFLKLIPSKPNFIPEKSNQTKAIEFLKTIYKSSEIEFEQTKDVEFIDQGANFESVSCNYCGRIIEMAIWQDAMDKAYKNQFKDLTFITPCCHKKTTLNDLNYQSPAGFSKFYISIEDPSSKLNDIQLNNLQVVLGTNIKMIWAHY